MDNLIDNKTLKSIQSNTNSKLIINTNLTEFNRVISNCEKKILNENFKKVKFDSICFEITFDKYFIRILGNQYIKRFNNDNNFSNLPESVLEVKKYNVIDNGKIDTLNNIGFKNESYTTVSINDTALQKAYESSVKKFRYSYYDSYMFNDLIINCIRFKPGEGKIPTFEKNKTNYEINITTNNSIDKEDLEFTINFILNESVRFSYYRKTLEDLEKVKVEYKKLKYNRLKTVTLTKERYFKFKEDIEEHDEDDDNLEHSYSVTTKADGMRMFGFIYDSYLYLNTDSEFILPIFTNIKFDAKFNGTIFDGEFIKELDKYYIFDLYYKSNENAFDLNFYERQKAIQDAIESVKSFDKYQVQTKEFKYINDETDLFIKCKNILENNYEYEIDGLVFTSTMTLNNLNNDVRKNKQKVFKWKDANFLSVDFKLKYNTKEEYIDEELTEGELNVYDLYLQYSNNTKALNFQVNIPIDYNAYMNGVTELEDGETKFIAFSPKNVSASQIKIERENSKTYCKKFDEDTNKYVTDYNQEIKNNNIVECIYRDNKWIPIRTRIDKERPNNFAIGIEVWKSLNVKGHNPITKEMIIGQTSIPEIDENQIVYYTQKEIYQDGRRVISDNVRKNDEKFRNFHRLIVKEKLFKDTQGKRLLDIGCGKLGDFPRIINYFEEYVGIDLSFDSIENGSDGAYYRILNNKDLKTKYNNNIPQNIKEKFILLVGNASLSFQDPETFKGDYEQVARTREIFAKPQQFDTVSSMFSMHYMFENAKTFNTLIENVTYNVKVGGFFTGVCFDGQRVFELLNDKKSVSIKTKVKDKDKDTTILKIKKCYKKKIFPNDIKSLGLTINVQVSSIGTPFDEYLVNFDLLEKELKKNGFRTIHMFPFEDYYNDQNTYKFTEEDQDYSFLNRSFIFQKVK